MLYKTLALIALISLLACCAFAEITKPAIQPKAVELTMGRSNPPYGTPPTYTFSRTPIPILTSYTDYMIGSFNGLPLRVIPDSAGGGYFLTYHASRTQTATRRVFYAYIDATGSLLGNSEIRYDNIPEGFPTLAVDPVSGKALYAWMINNDADPQWEVMYTSDAFIDGIQGLWNEYQVIVNNPISITTSVGTTTDNEFIWPTATIGPSPIQGYRRVYVACRNNVSHATIRVGNVYIAYADFNGETIENGYLLEWSYTSIPELNLWNAGVSSQSPNYNIACDDAGNLYYIGHHISYDAEGNIINNPDIDVFKCPAYGAGTWTRVTWGGTLPAWNPPSGPGLPGYFVNEATNLPYANNELFWKLVNSNHSNAGIDDLGRIHVPGLWALTNSSGAYYPNLQFVKALVYNTVNGTMSINEVFPRKHLNDNYNHGFTPWDLVAPWGLVDQYIEDGFGSYYPDMVRDWNFPHWNRQSHYGAMMYHCANMKVTNGNGYGMMAMVWQNSLRSQLYNENGGAAYQNYANVPEICISVSSNNGYSWSDPIYLNSINTPQLANMKPMWVYPADKVQFVGYTQNWDKIGKLGLMFYDDNTWGSNAIAPSEFPNDGGRVMFTELQIVFPSDWIYPPPTDPFGEPYQLSGSMNLNAGVMINNVMAQNSDVVAAYGDVNGISQLLGKGTVERIQGVAFCNIQIYTQTDGEIITFKHWNNNSGLVTNMSETLTSVVGGSVGEWPDNLFWLHEYVPFHQMVSMPQGWSMVSLNVVPANNSIISILSDIIYSVRVIKSPEGVFIPNNPLNTLTNLSNGKGYFIKLGNQRNLQVYGDPMNAANPIPLVIGWNLVGYNPQTAMGAGLATASLGDALVAIKGTEGIYIPGNPFNTLESMSPGRAYWIKTNAPATLVYPTAERAAVQALLPDSRLWGSPVIKTNSQAILARPDNARQGDVLAAFVGDELRGLSTIKSHDGISAALLQVFTDEPAEQIVFKLLQPETGLVSTLSPALSSVPGDSFGNYANGEYVMLKSEQPNAPELVTSLLSASPNPFKDGTTIAIQVAKNAETIKMEIYNLRGQKINTLFHGTMEAGNHMLRWNGVDENGNSIASGIYFCRLTGANTTQNIKLMILK